MNPSHRIVFNTAATYAHSVLGAGLAIFSSRWVLSALGQADFGLFCVVGSIIVFIVFVNTVMASSSARHYAYAIGQGDSVDVNRWFNASLSMHIVLAVVLVFIGWQIGEYVIANVLTIPQDRLSACFFVFRVSLVSAFVNIVSVPFMAMFMAKQRMAELAVCHMLYSLMTFSLAWFLGRAPGDRLLFYAFGMVSILVCVKLIQMLWALVVFDECSINHREWFDKDRSKEIIVFACWNLIGNFGALLRGQGTAILLNIQFGLRVNAAYGIANQVSTQTNQLSSAMQAAFTPEITTSEGRGDRARMLYMAERASKMGTILVLLFAIPLIVEMDYILDIWLREPPLHTSAFCRLVLITFVINRLTIGYMSAVLAHGKVAAYQVTVGGCLILTLPLVWIFFRFGAPPVSFGYAFIITMIAVSIGRLYWAHRFFGVAVGQWTRTVFLPSVIVGVAALIAALTPCLLMTASFMRLVYVIALSFAVTSLTTWCFAFDTRERGFMWGLLSKIIRILSRS